MTVKRTNNNNTNNNNNNNNNNKWHQYQGKRNEKREENEIDRGTLVESPNSIPGN